MRAYSTDEKTYIEDSQGICRARFCKMSMEFYTSIEDQIENSSLLYFEVNKTRELNKEFWIKFKIKVEYYFKFKISDLYMPGNLKQMTISTLEFNTMAKEQFKNKFGIDDYDVEYDFESKETMVIYQDCGAKRLFFPILVRWMVKDKAYSTLIRPILKIKESGSWPFKYNTHFYDIEAMEKEAIKLIEDSKRIG